MKYYTLFILLFTAITFDLKAQTIDEEWEKLDDEFSMAIHVSNYQEALQVTQKMKVYLELKNPQDPKLGLVYLYKASAFFGLEKYDSAIVNYNIAKVSFLNYFKKENINSVHTRVQLAKSYFETRQLNEAKEEGLKAYKIFQSLKIKKDGYMVDNLMVLSNIYEALNDDDKASQYLQEGISLILQDFDENYPDLSKFYRVAGSLEVESDNFVSGKEYLFKALKCAERTNNSRHKTDALNYLGIAYAKNKELNAAKKYYSQALQVNDLYKQSIEKKQYNRMPMLYNLGDLYFELSRMDSALYYFQLAESIIIQYANEPANISALYDKMGKLYTQQKKYKKAILYYQKSIQIMPENTPSDRIRKTNPCLHLGDLYEILHKSDSAEYYYKIAGQLIQIEKIKEYRAYIKASGKGDSLFYQNNYSGALSSYLKALSYLKIVYPDNNSIQMAKTYYEIGVQYKRLNKCKETIDYMWKAHNMYEALYDSRNSNCVKCLNHLKTCYTATGQQAALQDVEERLKIIKFVNE